MGLMQEVLHTKENGTSACTSAARKRLPTPLAMPFPLFFLPGTSCIIQRRIESQQSEQQRHHIPVQADEDLH
jgi:hypothetical protein